MWKRSIIDVWNPTINPLDRKLQSTTPQTTPKRTRRRCDPAREQSLSTFLDWFRPLLLSLRQRQLMSFLSSDSNSSSSSSAFIPLFSLLVTSVTGDVADSLPPLVLLPLQQAIPFKTEKKCHAWHKQEHTNSMALKDNGINTKRSIKTLRSSYPYKSSLNYVTPSSQARKLPIVMLLLALASLVRARLNLTATLLFD